MKIALTTRPAKGPLHILSLIENASLAAIAGLLLCAASGSANAADEIQIGPTVVTIWASTPAEAAYVTKMHEQLEKASRYPTGREASLTRPSGTSTVWVDVSRDGRVIERGVAQSSGSGLLDQMATSLVGRARYAALPQGEWGARGWHRFVVGYRFAAEADAPDTTVSVDVR